jgi:hypothetical protein
MLALVVSTSLVPGAALALSVDTRSPLEGRAEVAAQDPMLATTLTPYDGDQEPKSADGLAASKRRQRLKGVGAKHGERLGKKLGGKRGAKIGKSLGRQLGSKAAHNGAKRLGRHLLDKAGL